MNKSDKIFAVIYILVVRHEFQPQVIIRKKSFWRKVFKSIFNIVDMQQKIRLVWFYGISTIVGYLMPNPIYTYIYLVWFGFMAYQPLLII